jgi:hypothetical protein
MTSSDAVAALSLEASRSVFPSRLKSAVKTRHPICGSLVMCTAGRGGACAKALDAHEKSAMNATPEKSTHERRQLIVMGSTSYPRYEGHFRALQNSRERNFQFVDGRARAPAGRVVPDLMPQKET